VKDTGPAWLSASRPALAATSASAAINHDNPATIFDLIAGVVGVPSVDA
jgi:hypothetical protein